MSITVNKFNKTLQKDFIMKHEPIISTIDLCPIIYDKQQNNLKIVLHKRGNEKEPFFNHFALIGGFIRTTDMNINDAIHRIAKNKIIGALQIQESVLRCINLNDDFSTPDLVIGNNTRDNRGWTISNIYFMPLAIDTTKINKNETIFNVEEVNQLNLAFDHQLIIDKLMKNIQDKCKLDFKYGVWLAGILLSGYQVFTLTELQTIYELLIKEKIDKKTFRRKLENDCDFIKEMAGMKLTGLKARPAQVYYFNY